MSGSGPSGRVSPKRDSTALALMIGMILAVAVTAGASLSAAGSGSLQQALRAMGFGRDTEIQAEQKKQAAAIADMERILSRMDNEIGALGTRMVRSESTGAATSAELAKVDGALVAMGTEIKDLRLRGDSAASEAWRKPVEHLNTAVTGTRTDIINLRSSLDAYEQVRRSDVSALTRRLERVEQALVVRDATASVPNRSHRSEASDAGEFLGLRGSAGEARGGHVIELGTPVQ